MPFKKNGSKFNCVSKLNSTLLMSSILQQNVIDVVMNQWTKHACVHGQ